MAREARSPTSSAHERILDHGARVLSDAELLTLLLGPTNGTNPIREAAQLLLDAKPLSEIAWASPEELMQYTGIGRARAAAIAAAFELGRRGAWSPPQRGECILEPRRVFELMRYVAHAEREEFHTILMDASGRLIKTVRIAEGSLAECPVHPREALRDAVRMAAHSVIFVHCHPGGTLAASPEDLSLTKRLCDAADIVGVVPRDHVIVTPAGHLSFVEAGLWRRR
jgi:DNA repair protein RadC